MDDSDAREFSKTVCQETPPDLESVVGISKICGEQCYQRGYRIQSIFLNYGDHPFVPSIFMHGKGVLSQIEAVQMMVGRMKTALEEAQANLTIAQSRAKSQVDRLRHDEALEAGDEVVLSTRHISIN